MPSWRFGEYYEYGFLVPPLALGFAWRRAGLVAQKTSPPEVAAKAGRWGSGMLVVFALLLIILLRMIETGDPTWRPPIILHGLLVAIATHWLLGSYRGWKVSAFFLPVTIFAWSAVPYFWQLEQAMVRHLTDIVVGLTREIFLLSGLPVERMGERLSMGGQVCEVTDGCSGIRSIQSLVMAGLFFGELLWLRWPSRLFLVGSALAAAVLCNTGRAWYLASVQFSRGSEAVHLVHDNAGHIAFGVAALVLFLTARLLMPRTGGRVVIRTISGSGS